ncbi:MAG: type II secretion system F family protein [Lachnospiraceae bacterium]|nr:type II secretion system F family protein [Lachnospiraceae bacterium]
MKNLSVFCHMMYTLLHSGMDVKSAFFVIRDENLKGLGRAINNTCLELERGVSLSAAMRRDEKTYTPELVNAVFIMEQTGDPGAAFLKMADRFEAKARLSKRVVRACIYPVFIMGAVFGAVLAAAYVSGNLAVVLAGFIILAMIVCGLVFLRYRSGRLPAKDMIFGNILVRLPVAGPVIFEGEIAELAGNLALFASCGIPVGQALEYCAASVKNDRLFESVHRAAAMVTQGRPLSGVLALEGIFPKRMTDMIKTGEETGKLEDMLLEAERYYRAEVERKTQNLMALFRI